MNELLETEKMYVNELEAVLRGYIEEMENPDLVSFLPEALHGKRDVLFANWQELYNFHKRLVSLYIEWYFVVWGVLKKMLDPDLIRYFQGKQGK